VPELPEVETTRRGIAPEIVGRVLVSVTVRQRKLRWPIPRELERDWPGQVIQALDRRAKYLLFKSPGGTALLHLGMSGSLRVLTRSQAPQSHDHVDLKFGGGRIVRFTDPRRFGSLLWTRDDPQDHPLLAGLGPEPLGDEFCGQMMYRRSRGRRVAVKALVMNAHIVVGVGNIYASEALFRAGIHPRRPAGRISCRRYERLAQCIKEVLAEAIEQGGTTLRDFVDSEGQAGYFAQYLAVYDRQGRPCPNCRTPIRRETIAQRSTYFCPGCQR
jgi:formamidopyrimidine-DNA glycosylase